MTQPATAIHDQLMEKVTEYGLALLDQHAALGTADYDQRRRDAAAVYRQILDLSLSLTDLATKGA